MLPPQDAVPVQKGLRFHDCTPACVFVFQSGVSARWALATRCEIRPSRKCQPRLKCAIFVPVIVHGENNLEVAGRVGDTPIQCVLAPSVDAQICRSLGIPSTRLDEPSAATFLGGPAATSVRYSKPMGLQL
jgi:hypothetical protein